MKFDEKDIFSNFDGPDGTDDKNTPKPNTPTGIENDDDDPGERTGD